MDNEKVINFKIIELTLCSIIFAIFLQCCSEIKSENPVKEKISHKLPAYIEAFEDTLRFNLNREQIPGAAVAIVKDSSVYYMQTFGYAENGTGKAIDSNSVFRLGSLSKGFSAVLTGILVEKEVLDWHDAVAKHYPAFALSDSLQTQRVQIRHLLSHSSGLPYHAYTNLVEEGLSLNNIIPRLSKLQLIGREGEVYAYQNAAFAIIEKVIEAAADTTFTVLLEDKIFKPAHMNNASFSYEDLITSGNFAQPHFFSALQQDYVPIQNSKKYYNVVSAGGINASIADMAKWMQILIGNRPDIIADSTLDYIFNPVIKVNTRRYSRRWQVRRSAYALGWRVLNFKDRQIVFHGGYVNAYRSEIAIDPQNKLGICILVNTPHWYTSRIIPEFFSSFFIADTILKPHTAFSKISK